LSIYDIFVSFIRYKLSVPEFGIIMPKKKEERELREKGLIDLVV